ncbi:uncharacterized protein EDB91DRAFT_1349891 [Suillus paluster]|uniref:uncharacterized protein n=1 Tax=Suillus paluster TaxID=48578 RepID=UPI001B87256F|nr:uncharacterized protein EDB91DRAFT_1349891 [Suillus paluster]KAG1729208.1 hypothetical protein EDB91DRAFT_1349891 [Suillus paluster]
MHGDGALTIVGPVTLPLLPFLLQAKETTIILLDPILEVAEGKVQRSKNIFLKRVANIRPAEKYMAENLVWSRRGCVLAALGASMCDRTVVEEAVKQNRPRSFSGLFKNIPPNVNITVLASDPALGAICLLEHVPRDVERLNARVLPALVTAFAIMNGYDDRSKLVKAAKATAIASLPTAAALATMATQPAM